MEPLRGRFIGISGAVPDATDNERFPVNEYEIRMAVARLVDQVFDAGGSIVYGSHPTFTQIIEPRGAAVFARTEERRVLMYASMFFYTEDRWKEKAARHGTYATIVGTERRPTREEALTEMRRQMAEQWQALVCVGGRSHLDEQGWQTRVPGVAEEVGLTSNRPIFLVGCFGGYARSLWNDRPSITELNGLSKADNQRLNTLGLPAWMAVDLVMQGLIAVLGR